MTVPGIAKLSMVPNSKVSFPTNCWRTRIQAVSSPTPAVSGAETIAIRSVVQKEFQADPLHTSPCCPVVTLNACA